MGLSKIQKRSAVQSTWKGIWELHEKLLNPLCFTNMADMMAQNSCSDYEDDDAALDFIVNAALVVKFRRSCHIRAFRKLHNDTPELFPILTTGVRVKCYAWKQLNSTTFWLESRKTLLLKTKTLSHNCQQNCN